MKPPLETPMRICWRCRRSNNFQLPANASGCWPSRHLDVCMECVQPEDEAEIAAILSLENSCIAMDRLNWQDNTLQVLMQSAIRVLAENVLHREVAAAVVEAAPADTAVAAVAEQTVDLAVATCPDLVAPGLFTSEDLEPIEDTMNATIRECVFVTEHLDAGDVQAAFEALQQIGMNSNLTQERVTELLKTKDAQ